MNFEGVIDFTKYTLALSAGSFVYTLETFTPARDDIDRYVIVLLLVILLLASILGIAVLGVCTKAMHDSQKDQADTIKRVGTLGTWHSILLVVGVLGVGGLLIPHVLREAEIKPPIVVECKPATTP